MSTIYQGTNTTATVHKGAVGAQLGIILPYENSEEPPSFLSSLSNVRLLRVNSDTNKPEWWDGEMWGNITADDENVLTFYVGQATFPSDGDTTYTNDAFDGKPLTIDTTQQGALVYGKHYTRNDGVGGAENVYGKTITLLSPLVFQEGDSWRFIGGIAVEGWNEVLQSAYAYTDEVAGELTVLINGIPTAFRGSLSLSDPEPTVDGVYFFTESGTYENFGDVEVDLQDGIVYGTKVGSTYTATVVPLPNVDTVLNPDNTSHPVSGKAVSDYLLNVAEIEKIYPFTLYSGAVNSVGAIAPSLNWLHAVITGLPIGDVVIDGYTGTPYTGGSARAYYYDGDGNVIGNSGAGTSAPMTLTLPFGTVTVKVTVALGTDVGADPPSSPYYDLFKVTTGLTQVYGENITGTIGTDQVKTLEINANNAGIISDGVPSPHQLVMSNTALDATTGISYVQDSEGYLRQIVQGQKRKVAYPSGFSFQPFNIYKTASGIYLPELYDVSSLVRSELNKMIPYYVDPKTGLSTNNGLSRKSAFQTVAQAISAGAELIIMVGNSWSQRNQTPQSISLTGGKPLAIIADDGAKPVWSSVDEGDIFTWTKVGNLYRTSRTTIQYVIDARIWRGKEAGFFEYTKVDTQVEANDTPGTYYYDGTLVYINTIDGEPPTQDVKLMLQAVNGSFTVNSDVPFIYMDGITCYNRNTEAGIYIVNNDTTQYDTQVILKNMHCYNNSAGNGIAVNNIKSCYTQNCGGAGMLRDALNYHTLKSGYDKMEAVEINGWSYNTGRNSTTETSSNGSTAHDGMSIIRFGGKFSTSRGSTIIDVGAGIKSLNFNVEASNALLGTTAGFQIQNGEMWLYNCYSHDNYSYSAKADGSDATPTLYYDSETLLDGDTSGNVIPL